MSRYAFLFLILFRVAGCGQPATEEEHTPVVLSVLQEAAEEEAVIAPAFAPRIQLLTESTAVDERAFAVELAPEVSAVTVARALASRDDQRAAGLAATAYMTSWFRPLFLDPHYSIKSVNRLLGLVAQLHELGLDPFEFGLQELLSLTGEHCRMTFAGEERGSPELDAAVTRWVDAAPPLVHLECDSDWWPAEEDRGALDAELAYTYYSLALTLANGRVQLPAWKGPEDATANLVSLLPASHRYFARVAALRRFLPYWSTASLPTLGKWGSMSRGIVGPRVARLKRRLAAEGYYPSLKEEDKRAQKKFDNTTRKAVMAYRKAYGMRTKGKVDREMLEALSWTGEVYVKHLWRSLNSTITGGTERGGTYVLVNVPEFMTYFVANGAVEASYRSVVGFPYKEKGGRTPVLASEISYVDLNPEWAPTPYVVENELNRKARKDSRFFKENRFVRRGKKWIQLPGPKNTLGQVAIGFANDNNISLHGTPDNQRFSYVDRALSHGCVRVENIEDLAARILHWAKVETSPELETVFDRVIEKRVDLSGALPIYLVYDRVRVTDRGIVGITPDPYKLDRRFNRSVKLDPFLKVVSMARKSRRLARH